MDIDTIRKERQKWMGWKNIAPIRQALDALPACRGSVSLNDTIEIQTDLDDAVIEQTAKMMTPWRKGPFKINSVFIDSEWQSFIKYNLLAPHFNIEGKSVADIGCNNGYYLFRMLGQGAKELVGFDPSALNLCQFDFLDHFIQSGIRYELLGVEHLPYYEQTFDLIFCLGVLYHRIDPIGTLKSLYKGLNKGGEMILDTFMIDGEEEVALTPRGRYSRMRNVFFIPTVSALENWCYQAGFSNVELITTAVTTFEEQRATEWIHGRSLEFFLDEKDPSKTVEGYPAPKRVYIKAYK